MKSNKFTAYHLMLITISLILLAVFLNWSLLISFIAANLYCIFILNYQGYDVRTLIKTSFKETIQYKWLYLTIILIGATVSVWLSSGTIATMIFYGFHFIEGVNFVLFAFFIAALCSFFMGTAVGTFSTIGLILYSIGSVIGIPAPLLIGSIVSGSFVADKLSPISGLVNINLKVCDVKYNDALRFALKTLIPSFLITAFAYYLLGQEFIVHSQSENLFSIQKQLGEHFEIRPILFSLPVVILFLSVIGINSLYTIITGIALGTLFSLFLQNYSPMMVAEFLLFGYSSSAQGNLATILKGGGILRMAEVSVIVSSAVFLVNIFMKSGVLDRLIGDFVSSIQTPSQLLRKTGFLSIFLTVLTCDQTLGILLPATLLKDLYKKFHIRREILFRTVSDTGIVIAPILPWNINYLIITGIIGKGVFFSPYAFLCYIAPIVSLLASFVYPYKKHQ